jgi:hypothetical protein
LSKARSPNKGKHVKGASLWQNPASLVEIRIGWRGSPGQTL